MLNNVILVFLFVCFVFAVSYVYLRLKYETGYKSDKKPDDLKMSPEDVLKNFNALLKSEEYNEAYKIAKRYLAQDPYHHDLRRLLAKAYVDNSKDYDAISNLQVLVQFYPD